MVEKPGVLVTGCNGALASALSPLLAQHFTLLGVSKSQCVNQYISHSLRCDLSKQNELDQMLIKLNAIDLDITGFVHFAADFSNGLGDFSKISRTFCVNVFSAWRISEFLIERSTSPSSIVFVGSVGHKFGGRSDVPDYASSKYLLEYFPKFLRDCAPRVRVNTIRLGACNTGIAEAMSSCSGGNINRRNDLIPMQTYIRVEEIAQALKTLLDAGNCGFHNAIIPLTGGE